MDLKNMRLSVYDYDFEDRNVYKPPWNPYNKRRQILKALPLKSSSSGNSKAQAQVLQRTNRGFITQTSKSLDLIRQLIQAKINKEIDEVIQKYLEKFFKPGIQNICKNNGSDSVTDDHINLICCKILEDAKQLYQTDMDYGSTTDEPHSHAEPVDKWPYQKLSITGRKRKESDTDSENSLNDSKKRKHSANPEKPGTVLRPSMRFDITKWNPDRIHKDTLFIVGSRANKILGCGQMRGRSHNRHPEMIKYLCDQEDKEWLFKQHYLLSTGNKVYIMLLEDVTDLIKKEEYRSNKTMCLEDLQGFPVPDFLMNKVRLSVRHVTNELKNVVDLNNIDEGSDDSSLSTRDDALPHDPDLGGKFSFKEDNFSDSVDLQEFPNMRFSSDEANSPKHVKTDVFPSLRLDGKSESISVTLSSGKNLQAASPSTAEINAILETELDFETKVT